MNRRAAQSAGPEGIPATIFDPRGIDHRDRHHFNEAVGLRATIAPDWPQSKKILRLDSRLVFRLGAPSRHEIQERIVPMNISSATPPPPLPLPPAPAPAPAQAQAQAQPADASTQDDSSTSTTAPPPPQPLPPGQGTRINIIS
jgi:hypothetical protein